MKTNQRYFSVLEQEISAGWCAFRAIQRYFTSAGFLERALRARQNTAGWVKSRAIRWINHIWLFSAGIFFFGLYRLHLIRWLKKKTSLVSSNGPVRGNQRSFFFQPAYQMKTVKSEKKNTSRKQPNMVYPADCARFHPSSGILAGSKSSFEETSGCKIPLDGTKRAPTSGYFLFEH